MVFTLHTTHTDFSETLASYLNATFSFNSTVEAQAATIIEEVRKEKDKALLHYTQKFDDPRVTLEKLRIPVKTIQEAYEACETDKKSALHLAAHRIRTYHEKQMPQDFEYEDTLGVRLGNRWNAVDRVGIYVPGGLAVYPSSVLMNAIPAKVAGVKNVIMVVPAPKGKLNPLLLVAAHIAGIEEVYRVGGAQAIAALAYGTETIPAVDMIVGPGNAYVAAAKRQVFGKVGIDMIAGPSEIVVLADATVDPYWLAADLLSQAEHDSAARAILITCDNRIAQQVEQAVESILPTLSRREIAKQSWEERGAIIIARDLEEAVAISNQIAPEHLELAVADPDRLLPKITHAGAIFLGAYTPEAIGDYTAGPSHVLPTNGTARFSSGLSVFTFLKRSSVIHCSKTAFSSLQSATEQLALEEGLEAHALSVSIRK